MFNRDVSSLKPIIEPLIKPTDFGILRSNNSTPFHVGLGLGLGRLLFFTIAEGWMGAKARELGL